jgi:kumamolisin
MSSLYKTLAGSYRVPMHNAVPTGPVDEDEVAEVLLRVRSRESEPGRASRLMAMNSRHPRDRVYISREALAARRGTDPEDLARLEVFAHRHHLSVGETSLSKRMIRLVGTLGDLSDAFRVRLQEYNTGIFTYRGRAGHVHIPSSLVGVVEGVFGLDNRPAARPRPHLRGRSNELVRTSLARPQIHSSHNVSCPTADNWRSPSTFTVLDLARFYNFPPELDGSGECIALIELNTIDKRGTVTGAGYRASDLKIFFSKLGTPIADISAIGVNGGMNKPGLDETGDAEVTIDIEIAGAIAPGARIAVYFAPDTEAGFLEVVASALYDDLRRPSIISISWGNPEDTATSQFRDALNDVLVDAAELGVTVCCEAGDWGSVDQPPQSRDGKLHVEFPASSPYALSCGGTRILNSRRGHRETVWNDGAAGGASGGGVSNEFPRPQYQSSAGIPVSPQGNRGRGIPDVACNAVGYRAILYGKEIVVHGTSNVAPLWAGLIARINQSLIGSGSNRVGFLNPLIYGRLHGDGAFYDITSGNNHIAGRGKKYSAAKGWDACTGLGSPNGKLLLKQLHRAKDK